jgi:glycosyltransferase involved in cell wall biosynthesis
MTTARPLTVDFVIPTLNSGRTLRACLEAIGRQGYPRDAFRVIVADGGSTDCTVAVAESFDRVTVVPNALKTGEAGKAAGIAESSGDLIALVDSDNLLEDPRWMERMLAPFDDPEIVATEPLRYTRRDQDPPLTRYFAMLGMNDPLCLFLGNYDRECLVTGRWSGLDLVSEDRGDSLKLTLREDALPTIGANGFVFRRTLLDHVTWSPYFFDIDVVHQAVRAGFRHVAKVKCGIVHLYCSTLRDFARKQDRRVKDFLFFAAGRQRTYPWKQQNRMGILWFALATVTIVPLVVQIARGWRRQPDPAWFYHVPVCWITLWVYGRNVIAKALGVRAAPKSRADWQRQTRDETGSAE